MPVNGQQVDTISVIEELIGIGLLNQADQLCRSAISTSGETPQLAGLLDVIQRGKLTREDSGSSISTDEERAALNEGNGCDRFGAEPVFPTTHPLNHGQEGAGKGPRVLLINPHDTKQLGFTNPPLGLLYIAGTLVKNGFEVHVADGCLEGRKAIADAISRVRPQIVGITCLTPGRKKALEVAQMVKDHDRSTRVVLGGAHPTIMFRQILQEYPDLVDYVVLGEGELTFLEIVQGKAPSEINGIAYLENGKLIKTPHRKYIENLDDLPFPAWHLIDVGKYPARGPGMFRGIDLKNEPRISVIFSRGCTGHCSFCSTWWIWKGWRHRSAKNMVDELEMLYTKYNLRHFAFADDTLTADREATIQLCDEIISRNLHIAFHVTTRTDCVDGEVLDKLSRAGCYNIAFGIETGSRTLLDKLGKENDIEHSEKAIQLAKKSGMIVTALIMIGNMGETEETVQETIEFLRRTRPQDIGCAGGLWILPGTKVFFEAKKKGYIDDTFWLSDEPYKVYTLEWPLDKLKEFEQRVYNYNRGYCMAPTTKHKEQTSPPDFQDKWNRYVHSEVNEYSSTSEWKDAQALHLELFNQIPQSCTDVLDLGCGDGWSTYQLSLRGKRAVGVTSNEKEAAHAAAYGIKVVVQDMHDLKFADKSFDLIYCREVLEHSVAPYLALCEMNRVLKPGGYALINLPWEEWIRDDSHFSVMTPPQMREMFYKTRFIVRKEGRSSAGHFWYLAKKVAEIGEKAPFNPPKPGEVWIVRDSELAKSGFAADPGKTERRRIIGMLRIKNEEKWIAKVLEKASGIVDGFVILDDGSTDSTPQICRSFPNVLHYEIQKESGVDEARDKNKLLKLALSYNPDWILAIDGDEVLEDAAGEAIPALLDRVPQDVTVIGVNFLYMWNRDDLYRYDGKYCGINHPRLFKVGGLGIDPGSLEFKSTQHGGNFHCGSVPSNMPGRVFESDIRVKHYGYFEKGQRELKKEFYLGHDPEHAAEGYYDHLTDEQGIVLFEWKERKPDEVACLKAFPAGDEMEIRNRFDRLPQYYRHLRREILDAVPADAMYILDVGCGAGILGKALKEAKPGRKVYGIELNQEAFFFARKNLDSAYNVDVESFTPPIAEGELDCIIFADVLEHLKEPWEVLARFSRLLKADGKVVISIPNVRNLGLVRDLAEFGKWEYQEEGILDRTHLRFFTRQEFSNLLLKAGIKCETVSYLGTQEMQQYRPQGPGGLVRIGNLELHNVSEAAFDEMSATQILFVGKYLSRKTVNLEDADAYYAEAQSLIARHKYDEAAEILKAILAVAPDHPSLLNDLAVIRAQQGNLAEAAEILKRVLTVDAQNSVASQNLRLISAQLGQDVPIQEVSKERESFKSREEAIARAEELIQAKGYAEASLILFDILERHGLDVDALNDLAVIHILTGKTDDALSVLEEILKIDPENEAAIGNFAVVKESVARLSEQERAERDEMNTQSARRSNVQDAESVPVSGGMIPHSNSAGRHDDGATQSLQNISSKSTEANDDKSAAALYNEAQALIEKGDHAGALKLLNELVSIFPEHVDAHNDLAVLYHQNGNAELALTHLERCVEIEPNDAVAAKNLAMLYSTLGRFEEALGLFQRLLQNDPTDVQLLLSVADICVKLGKLDDAKVIFGRILTLDVDEQLRDRIISVVTEIDGRVYKSLKENSVGDGRNTGSVTVNAPAISISSDKTVSIVIPVFNKVRFTERCLQSIIDKVRYPHYEVIVVDNASTDATQSFMTAFASGRKQIRYIRNEENLGFVDACNLGAENASGDYILLLNNDTVVNNNWLEALVDFAEKTPDCGAVGSKLIYPDGRLQEAGGITFSDANGWNYGRGMDPNEPKFNFVREVDYISGASLMVRKDLWKRVGGLDRRYAPAYYEDADLCFAIRSLGYKVYFEPRSSLFHFEGVTSGTNLQEGFKKYQVVNRPKFMEKWKKELGAQYGNSPANVEKASSKGVAGRVLVVDPMLPMYDRAAGSLHLFNILKILRSMNFHITFIATNWSLYPKYRPILEQMGIETYAGDPDAMLHFGYSVKYPKIDYPALFREREFDFAIINFWYQAEFYLPLIRKYSPHTKIIIDSEDVHFVREIREAELKKDGQLKSTALGKKKRELAIYKQADHVWVVTENDREALRKEKVEVPIEIRPVVHDFPAVRNGFSEREGLLFVGNFNHTPNFDALSYFVKDVFPEVLKSVPGLKLYVVGNDPRNQVSSFTSENVIGVGYVENLAEYYERCRIAVAPLRYGAGLKGKIVESLSYGVPVVTTSIGVEGTGLNDGSELMVADDPVEMAKKIAEVYSRKEIWESLSSTGRATMNARWSFEAGRRKLEQLLSSPAQESPGRARGSEAAAKLTSIVILTYNQLKYTRITLDSIRRHTKTPYEIIVVDNASSDGTVEYIKAQKDIRAIFNEENVGFPAGCNQGMEIAKGDYIVLLNNDVIVTDDWLEGLIECSGAGPNVGIVGPRTNWISGYQLEQEIPYKKVSQMPVFAAKYRRKNRRKWIEVPRVAGFCMLIKREVVGKIGGLDTVFGIGNCEDDDYCMRSRLSGFKVALAGDVFIHHFGSKSFNQKGIDKYLDTVRGNEKVFEDKWGVDPAEWWRDGKEPTKSPELFVPLTAGEPVPLS